MADVPSPQFRAQADVEIPDHTTLLFTNSLSGDPIQQMTFLPEDGTLFVGYEFIQEPATVVQIRHQDGSTETIEPGFNNRFTVKQFDAIVVQLATPDQAIILGWAYV